MHQFLFLGEYTLTRPASAILENVKIFKSIAEKSDMKLLLDNAKWFLKVS